MTTASPAGSPALSLFLAPMVMARGIDMDGPKAIVQIGPNVDVASQRTVEKGPHAVDQLSEIDRLGLQGLAPGEGEQLTAERRPPVRRLAHLIDDALSSGRPFGSLQQAQSPGNDHQQVVEIVRHAARELAERVDLLRLAKLFLRLGEARLIANAFGDVVDELESAHELSVAITERVELHLVGLPRKSCVPELVGRREFLAAERPAPISLHLLSMLGQVVEQRE
jgi:hypothetical protein